MSDASVALLHTALGYMPAQIVHAAVRIGLADALGDDEVSVIDAAARTATRVPQLRRLLRALATLGLVEQASADTFRLTAAGRPLRADAEDSVRPMVLMYFDDAVWRSWAELTRSLRTGRPAFDHATGADVFTHLADDPDLADVFHAAMASGARDDATHVVRLVDFTRFSTVADIGGGDGTLLATILVRHPGLTGAVFDTPAGTRGAPDVLAAADVADRCRVECGDFFTAVPAGYAAYVLKSVLHDWSDDRAADILRSCRQAIPADGTLLIVELVAPERATAWADPFTTISDMNLMVMTAGRERTEAEWRTLLRAGPFDLVGVSDPFGAAGHRIIEAVPR
jgi:hypothetical protein